MNPSFEFDHIAGIVPLAIGQPGERTFYLQVHQDGVARNFKCEKGQIAGMAEYLERLADASGVGGVTPLPATLPVDTTEWPIGQLTVAFDQANGHLVLILMELVVVEGDDEMIIATGDDEDNDLGIEFARAEIALSPAQARAFALAASTLVAAGRPECDLCGSPIDAGGHFCPRMN